MFPEVRVVAKPSRFLSFQETSYSYTYDAFGNIQIQSSENKSGVEQVENTQLR